MSSDMNSHWFAVKTRPRQEGRAEENLLRQGFEIYFPRIRVRKRRRNSWASISEPLFPGYIFLRANPSATSLGPVRSTLGVKSLVVFGHQLKPVPDAVIAFIREQEDTAAGCLVADALPYARGDRVEIIDGPFAGITAVFQMEKGGDRALVLIQLLGKENRLLFSLDQISPLP